MEVSFFSYIFVTEMKNKGVYMNRKELILNEIRNVKTTNARNSMGCSENWYNAYFAISKTFTMDELEAMSENELNNLVKLADAIAEGLY